jgi:hypothetical protein
MGHPDIALALSAVCFGLVIGFLAGYAVRAYLSQLRRRANREWQPVPTSGGQPAHSGR